MTHKIKVINSRKGQTNKQIKINLTSLKRNSRNNRCECVFFGYSCELNKQTKKIILQSMFIFIFMSFFQSMNYLIYKITENREIHNLPEPWDPNSLPFCILTMQYNTFGSWPNITFKLWPSKAQV